MPITDASRADIAQLVARFHAQSPAERRRANRNEAQTCQDFILPLFKALGWQVDTDAAGATDVAQQVGIAGGRVDYAFRAANVTRFLLEAKKLTEDMTKPEWADQAVRYAYNKGVRWAVLTNFEALQVFNAFREGAPHQHVVLNMHCDEFVDRIDELWLLSKEAMLDRRLDEDAVRHGGADPREPVERRLANVLRTARQDIFDFLSTWVASMNMPTEEIDSLIQSLLNRLVFIRTAEDRDIEDQRLREALNQYRNGHHAPTLLENLRVIFNHYAQQYDSDLFPLIGDPWAAVYVEDTRVAAAVGSLYKAPGSSVEFDFSAISADALGQIYEQYLGSEVRRRPRPQAGLPGAPSAAETVDRRQARRERGVYYTPRFIVDYIVAHTVEALIYEQPDRLADIRVADIACGSGSFLIRAYDVLLEVSGQGMSQAERIDLLRRSIFGVDLDRHAVDVARLNLLLRALAEPIQLPMLKDNLVVRNSLIHGSAAELRPFFGDRWSTKLRLDCDAAFPDVAAAGGFDVIVGNPPYVEIQTQDRQEAEYLRATYAVSGSFDVYVPFIQRALQLVKPGGRVGYIVPHKFMTNASGRQLRELLAGQAAIEEIVHFGDQQIFEGVATYTCVLILRRDGGSPTTQMIRPVGLDSVGRPDRDWLADTVEGLDTNSVPTGSSVERGEIDHPTGGAPWDLTVGPTRLLVERLRSACEPLSTFADRVFQGLITSADHLYHLRATPLLDGSTGFQRFKAGAGEPRGSLGLAHRIEPDLMKPLLSGADVDRYAIKASRTFLLFPYSVANGVATLRAASDMARSFPGAWTYLRQYEARLRDRETDRRTGARPFDDGRWYRFGRTQGLGLHASPKLAVPRLVQRLSAAADPGGTYSLDNVDVGGISLSDARKMWWCLALLNSRVLGFVFRQQDNQYQHGFRTANRQFIDPLPIAPIDRDLALTARVISLAEDMHNLMERKRALAPTDAGGLQRIQQEFADADREMDGLVADAYGLTTAERALVFA